MRMREVLCSRGVARGLLAVTDKAVYTYFDFSPVTSAVMSSVY
jgi:hypothetical protein